MCEELLTGHLHPAAAEGAAGCSRVEAGRVGVGVEERLSVCLLLDINRPHAGAAEVCQPLVQIHLLTFALSQLYDVVYLIKHLRWEGSEGFMSHLSTVSGQEKHFTNNTCKKISARL